MKQTPNSKKIQTRVDYTQCANVPKRNILCLCIPLNFMSKKIRNEINVIKALNDSVRRLEPNRYP